ncbi:hypothetical protein EV426DRAFT_438416 [Tirmania nivea]|nr:hypothetical protein EV426DRAFT_438416 [Tirmania nivea]
MAQTGLVIIAAANERGELASRLAGASGRPLRGWGDPYILAPLLNNECHRTPLSHRLCSNAIPTAVSCSRGSPFLPACLPAVCVSACCIAASLVPSFFSIAVRSPCYLFLCLCSYCFRRAPIHPTHTHAHPHPARALTSHTKSTHHTLPQINWSFIVRALPQFRIHKSYLAILCQHPPSWLLALRLAPSHTPTLPPLHPPPSPSPVHILTSPTGASHLFLSSHTSPI